jgi:HEAT repeat protein
MWVRYHGVHSLAARAKQAGVPAWLPARLVERARTDSAPPVRIAAMEAIAALRIDRGVPALIAALNDPEPDIASQAAAALGAFGNAESRAALVPLVTSERAPVRRAAIESLGRLKDSSAVDAIRDVALNGGDDLACRVAIGALAKIGSVASTNALIALLAERGCRAEASRALTTSSGVALSTMIDGLRHPDAGIRCTLIEILARVRRADITRAVSEALGDDTAAVRNAAEQALTRRDLSELDQAIESARADLNPTVRSAAASVTERQ